MIADAVIPDQPLRIGDALSALGRSLDLTDADIAAINAVRDDTPATPPAMPGSSSTQASSWRPEPAA